MIRRRLWAANHECGKTNRRDRARRWRAPLVCTLMAVSLGLTAGTTPLPVAAMEHRAARGALEHAVALTPRRPLLAHVRFCLIYPDQCETRPDRRDPSMTATEQLRQIRAVNFSVNRAIIPTPDEGFDSWDIDVTHGDCEDYALQKRKELIDLGWPTKLLRIAITRTPEGILHAVLLVRIDGTDYALDNMTSRVLPWDQTPYDYLMAQGTEDVRSWYTVTSRARQGTS